MSTILHLLLYNLVNI